MEKYLFAFFFALVLQKSMINAATISGESKIETQNANPVAEKEANSSAAEPEANVIIESKDTSVDDQLKNEDSINNEDTSLYSMDDPNLIERINEFNRVNDALNDLITQNIAGDFLKELRGVTGMLPEKNYLKFILNDYADMLGEKLLYEVNKADANQNEILENENTESNDELQDKMKDYGIQDDYFKGTEIEMNKENAESNVKVNA